MEKHFLVSLQDLSLDILQLLRVFGGVYVAYEPRYTTSEGDFGEDLRVCT